MEDCAVVVGSANVANANAINVKAVGWIQVPIANVLTANVVNLRMTKFVLEMEFVIAMNVYVILHIPVITTAFY